MLTRLLPARADNDYRGRRAALWLLVPIAAMKVALSSTHLFRFDGGAQSIATIPLDGYPASASQNIVALFARLGLEQALLACIYLLILVRYRALIPLAYLMLVVHYFGGRLVAAAKPLSLAGTSGAGTPALVVAVLAVIGLVLSLTGPGYAEPHDR
jgi:hypothetical protein